MSTTADGQALQAGAIELLRTGVARTQQIVQDLRAVPEPAPQGGQPPAVRSAPPRPPLHNLIAADRELLEEAFDTWTPTGKPSLADLAAHAWFGSEDYKAAISSCTAAVATHRAGKPKQTELFKRSILSCYHHDRAARAASFLPGERLIVERRDVLYYCDLSDMYAPPRELSPAVLVAIAGLVAEVVPDAIQHTKDHTGKPAGIYAQYGEWYVRLA
jgi:hypothetical protein